MTVGMLQIECFYYSAKKSRDVTKCEFEFDDVRTSNVFSRFEIRRMF